MKILFHEAEDFISQTNSKILKCTKNSGSFIKKTDRFSGSLFHSKNLAYIIFYMYFMFNLGTEFTVSGIYLTWNLCPVLSRFITFIFNIFVGSESIYIVMIEKNLENWLNSVLRSIKYFGGMSLILCKIRQFYSFFSSSSSDVHIIHINFKEKRFFKVPLYPFLSCKQQYPKEQPISILPVGSHQFPKKHISL